MSRGGVLLGIDVGGTKIGIGLGNAAGDVWFEASIPTEPSQSPEELTEHALSVLLSQVGDADVRNIGALGVSCPGPLSRERGQLLSPPNLPGWHGFELVAHARTLLARMARVDVPVGLMNDANAAVLAEWHWGAARGANTAILLTMSTGMGAGLIIDGRLFEGPLGLAGEVGHIRISDDGPAAYGRRGSVEGFTSGPGLVQLAQAEAARCRTAGQESGLVDDSQDITPQRICVLAEEGDAAALAVVHRCCEELGRLCAITVDLLNPDTIILGTIGSEHFQLFEPLVRAVVDREALPEAARHVSIVKSDLLHRSSRAALAVAREFIEEP